MSQANNIEHHRQSCEIRWCLDQTREDLADYYRRVASARGRPAQKRLAEAVKAEHARRQGEAQEELL